MGTLAIPEPHWVMRVIESTQGPNTLMGAIIIAALGRKPKHPPYFDGQATIQANGDVTCDFVRPDNKREAGKRVCSAEDLVRNVTSLSEWAALKDDEKLAFCDLIHQWCPVDLRPKNVQPVIWV